MTVSRREQWASKGPGKTIAAASSAALARRLTTSMRRMGIQMKSKAKHLGILFGPGARTREPSGRGLGWAENAARRKRVFRLGRRLGAHVFKIAVSPSALYGSSIAVPVLRTVRSVRGDAARAFGPIKGRSTAWIVVTKPITAWVGTVWDGKVPTETLAAAWKFASTRMIATTKPSATAGGAAGAYLATLHRIQRTSPSYDHACTRDGTLLDLTSTAPYTVMQFVKDDFQIVTAAATSLATRLTVQCGIADEASKESGTAKRSRLGPVRRSNRRCKLWFLPGE